MTWHGVGSCGHSEFIFETEDRYICGACKREWKKPMYDVIGDLDGVRSCYGREPVGDQCDECPVKESCIQLARLCGVKGGD